MARSTIDRLVVNSPYEEPAQHWRYDRTTRRFDLVPGRRPAGYVVASEDSRAFDDPGAFVEIPLVNAIRPRVKAWREAGWPGASAVTRRLLQYWNDPEEFETRRFFFCQIEAVETLIWLTEAPAAERTGVEVPSDGGGFERVCAKMATGAGKTVVMAMVVAWQVLNKAAHPRDRRFSRNVLVVAPGLTVRSRLAVLEPSHPESYYEAFHVVPSAMLDRLRRGRVIVRNRHALHWEGEEQVARRRSVDKRGVRSDEAWVRDVLGDMAKARDLLVVNDEAHHAWRVPERAGSGSGSDSGSGADAGAVRIAGIDKAAIEEATKWVGGLDRIDRARGILRCYDFSATPFAPSGRKSSEEALFGWIVSDFGLNDAIEAGLVKTPRVVVRDDAMPDAGTWKSRLYHIYNDPEVKDDLNRRAGAEEPLPDLVLNGYYLLGYDWRETARRWAAAGFETPPVMITVANRTETAARVKHAFDTGRVRIDALCDPARTLHIDSKVLSEAEAQDAVEPIAGPRKLNAKQRAELLRRQVDTVGRPGQPGGRIRNVISVGMLSEGWDAKTVTHIMGLRAFASQLLCEQVVGRGLRRTAYEVAPDTGLFEPEYVNVFGVPFTFLPHEGGENGPPPPPEPKTAIEPDRDKAAFEIRWPNVIRIDRVFRPRLTLDWDKVEPLILDAGQTARIAELAPVVEGKPDMTMLAAIDLERLAREFRTQRIVFETARDVYDGMRADRDGSGDGSGSRDGSGNGDGDGDGNGSGDGSRGREQGWKRGFERKRKYERERKPGRGLDRKPRSPAGPDRPAGRTVRPLRPDRHRAAPVRRGRSQAAAHAGAEHDPGRAARLAGDPLREHRTAHARLRPRPPRPLHRRHGDLVHRPPLRPHRAQPHQLLRPRQHLGGVGSPRPGPQPPGRRLGEERPLGLRGLLRPRRRRPQVPPGLPHPAWGRRHAGPGGQGQGARPGPHQAAFPRRMGRRRQCPRRLRPLAVGGLEEAERRA